MIQGSGFPLPSPLPPKGRVPTAQGLCRARITALCETLQCLLLPTSIIHEVHIAALKPPHTHIPQEVGREI